jgi:hypothetical protein
VPSGLQNLVAIVAVALLGVLVAVFVLVEVWISEGTGTPKQYVQRHELPVGIRTSR